jgi:hypothetical protein
LILTAFLGFLETYWIHIALYLGLSIHCGQQEILGFFKIDQEEDIVCSLSPKALSILIWIIQGVIAEM